MELLFHLVPGAFACSLQHNTHSSSLGNSIGTNMATLPVMFYQLAAYQLVTDHRGVDCSTTQVPSQQ